MLEVVTPAANKQLTTLEAVKGELGITDTAQDALLSALSDRASDAIVTFCGRPFAQEGYRETVAGYGGTRLLLSRTPVVGVASVLADSEIITDWLLEDAEAGLLFRKRGWQWAPILGWNIVWQPVGGSENLNFTVEYTAGYVLPGDAGVRTLPCDIEQACIEVVKAWYAGRERDPAITGERLGDYQASYAVQGLPAAARELLVPWRRLV